LSDAIPPLCGGLGATLIFYILLKDVESHTYAYKINSIPQRIDLITYFSKDQEASE